MKKRYHTEVVLKAPRSRTGRPFAARPMSRANTRNKPADTASTAIARSRWNRCPGGEFEFVNDIFGAPFPRTTFRHRKGNQRRGRPRLSAGFPMVDFRVILYDGSYHDVDSNDMSFQMAGRIAFRKAMEQAKLRCSNPSWQSRLPSPTILPAPLWRPEQPPRTHPGYGHKAATRS